jgi:glycosyltransferase involved in cell wall biosynthesis
MRLAIVSPDYSSPGVASYAFVHARAVLYQQAGVALEVFVPSARRESYHFEGIRVHKYPASELQEMMIGYAPDVMAVHYPVYSVIDAVKGLPFPTVAWIHGHEIIRSLRLRSSKGFADYIKKRLVLIPREFYQFLKIRRYLKTVNYSVFVSEWMHRIGEKNVLMKIPNAVIVPNPVDTRLFEFKEAEMALPAISVRSFDNKKYGMDIAVKAFSGFRQKTLRMYGKGRFLNALKAMKDKGNSNVEFIPEHIDHAALPAIYHQHSFFVAPSRVEAQGVAMCEAMACGLPVIATTVGGIPEFVRDGVDGFLVEPEKPAALINAVADLLSDPERFSAFSRNARQSILEKCSESVIIPKELELLRKAMEEK